MRRAELLRMALRYTLSFGRGHLSVFMSSVSMVGLIFATALLLTVLAVMNGFEREMRERILDLVPHITVFTPTEQAEAEKLGDALREATGAVRADAFVSFDAMLVNGSRVTAVRGRGTQTPPSVLAQALESLWQAPGNVIAIGDSVAARIGVIEGDVLTLIVPTGDSFRRDAINTLRVRVSRIVDTGTEIDEALLLTRLDVASRLAGIDGAVTGLELSYSDPFRIDSRIQSLRRALPPGAYATTWRMTHGNLYAAIQLSRNLVTLLLTSIIGVAAFNVVSALVLIVTDQRKAMAVLRTLGATPAMMGQLFIVQGFAIGVIGSVLGCALGAGISAVLPGAIAQLELLLEFRFLSTDVYPVSFIPVDLRARDAGLIMVTSIAICVVAALYPALRASRIEPARVLRQEA
ncbi:MAG: lipoprotein-releasing ABC transporter permease subunit [Congregibacter sp.]